MRRMVPVLLVLGLGACAKGASHPVGSEDASSGNGGEVDGGGATGGIDGSAGGSGGVGGGGANDGAVDGSGGGIGDGATDAGGDGGGGTGADGSLSDAGDDAAMPAGAKRKQLTIVASDTEGAIGTHTDFPVLVRVTGSDFLQIEDDIDANGYDLRFTSDAAGTTDLPFERVRYDELGNQLVAWVRMDVADAGQDFYLVYGEGDVTDKSSIDAWSNGYDAVWHLEDVANLVDASGQGKMGTNQGASNASNGVAGGAASFNGSSAYISASPFASIDGGTFSVSAWVMRDTDNTYDYVLGQGDTGAMGEAFHWGFEHAGDGNNFRFAFWGDDLNTSSGYSDIASYVYWVGTFDAASRARILYRDGVQVGSDTAVGLLNTTGNFEIGRQSFSNTDHWDGTIDEVRVSSAVRSASWIRTEYNNQRPGSTFLTVGAEAPL